MTTYIVLLRGINVGGKNLLPMKDLIRLLERHGMRDVRTYIQSGNVVVRHAGTKAGVETIAGTAIEKAFGFRPELIVLTAADLDRVIARNPFPTAAEVPVSLHVMFLRSVPRQPELKALDALKAPGERFALKEKAFYLHAPDGIGRSKLAARIEKALGVAGTARNWRTVMQLEAMARANGA